MTTGISYVDETFNPVQGCTPVSPGCDNCYAKAIAHRFKWGLTDEDGEWTGDVRLVPEALEKPLRWRKPRTVLVPSMGDLFHERVPHSAILGAFSTMAEAHRHTFLVPTKRPDRMLRCCRGEDFFALDTHGLTWTGAPARNVLLGCTVEDQRRADERLPVLAEIAAMGWRTWVSVEPLLGPVDLGTCCKLCGREYEDGLVCNHSPPPEFVAVGGETGAGARPCDMRWIDSIVRQSQRFYARCHVKQLSKGQFLDPKCWPRDLPEMR
jgi:protein gp37